MVKPDRFKETPRKKIFRTTLSASPTYQGSFRHNEPLEEPEFESNSISEELIEEIARERDELDEKRKVHPESASQPRPSSPEIKDVAWLIVNRALRYCKGKELLIFGLITTICFALLCIQLALLRKSPHEVGTEQMGDIVNKLITENEQFKSEILAKIGDIDEVLRILKFESQNAFHNKLLKEVKRRDQTLPLVTLPSIWGKDIGKKFLVDDKEKEFTNEGKEKRGWIETIKDIIISLTLVVTLFCFHCFFDAWRKKPLKNQR